MRDIDIMESYSDINLVIQTLKDIRLSVDVIHNECYEVAVTLAESVNIEPLHPEFVQSKHYVTTLVLYMILPFSIFD